MTGRGTAEPAVALAALTWIFVASLFPLSDYDFWWHLRTGQLILDQGTVPRTDWFTYTNVDSPWIDLHWGFQIAVAKLYALGGSAAIVVAKAVCLTLAVALGWFAAGRHLPGWVRGLVWAPSLIALYGRAFERPEIVSLALLAAWLWVTFDFERRARWIWILPVVQLMWVNCHSLFALGPVVGVAAAIDYATRRWLRGRRGCDDVPARPGVASWLAVAGLVAAACFVNPYFERGAFFPWVVYRKFTVEQPFYAARIGEFQRPWDFLREHGLTSVTLTAELAAGAAALVSFFLLATQRRWSPLRLLLFGAFAHLAWEAARNTNLFCLVAAAITCANASEWLGLRRAAARAAEPSPQGTSDRSTAGDAELPAARRVAVGRGRLLGNLAVTCLFIVGIGLVLTGAWGRWTGGTKAFGWGERPDWFAHDAARFAGRDGMPDHALIAHFGQAAVYAYHQGPRRKVFMDGRLEVCSQLTFEQWEWTLAAIASGDRRWEATHVRQYGSLPAVILDRIESSRFIDALRQTPGWRAVYADRTAVVFVDEKTAARLKLAAVSPTDK